MFNIATFNRLLQQRRQAEKVILLPEESGLTPKQIAAGLKALRLLKLTDLEHLHRSDLMDFLYAMGMNPTPDVLDGKLRQLRLHRERHFTWGELAHVWHLLMNEAVNEDVILERAFQFFDKDGNGEIDVAELRTTMHELGDLLTEEEIQAFMAIMDSDNDGIIGYQDFLDTLRTEAPEFAGKAMRDTRDLEGMSDSLVSSPTASSAASSPFGPASHAGLRQMLAASPNPDKMQLLGANESSDGTITATAGCHPCTGLGEPGGFDGVRRSAASLNTDGDAEGMTSSSGQQQQQYAPLTRDTQQSCEDEAGQQLQQNGYHPAVQNGGDALM
eukprot:gene10822-10979_t